MTPGESKIATLEQVVGWVSEQRGAGRSIVLANGAFDLLHVGHIRYLSDAARYGDVLVVALNSDESVLALKGAGRPIVPLNERLEMVAALQVVDRVFAFDASDVREVIRQLSPDIHAKGTDYTPEGVPEAADMKRIGGKTVICGDPKEHSTTQLLAQLIQKKTS